MSPSASGLSRRAVGWALLSQAIWLPLLGIAAHDRWQSASASRPSGTTGSASSAPVSPAPLSLRELTAASGLPQNPPDPATAAVPPGPLSGPGLVLQSPPGIAGLSLPPEPATGPGPASAAFVRGRLAGSPAPAGVPPLRLDRPPAPPRDRGAAARPASRADVPSAGVPASGPARWSASLSQRLGGPIGLRDLSGLTPGSVASLRQDASIWTPAAGHAGSLGAATDGGARGGTPARAFWAPPPPLPPLP